MTGPAVVIAGAGPTGLMLAAELALARVEVALLERRPDQELIGQRALGFFARTLEVFDQRGIADRFLERAKVGQFGGFAWIPLPIDDFPTRHHYGVGLAQQQIELILAQWAGELGVPVQYGTEVTGFTQDEAGVEVELSDGRTLHARYLVGCDGGRSTIRKSAGIDFPGWDASISNLIGEVELTEEPEWGVHRTGGGLHSFARPDGRGLSRVMVSEQQPGRTDEPTLADLSEALIAVFGTDYGLHGAAWISRFSDMARQAAAYRDRRVLLAGDSAHVHYPMGGQGLGVGVQDAVNLGWKLARVVDGTAPESLLDTYHAERHPVAARVLHNTLAQVALTGTGPRTEALRDIVTDLLSLDEPRKRIAAMMTGLDIRYDLGGAADVDGAHPLLGRRMPDLDLVTPDGPRRVYALLHPARPVLLSFAESGAFDLAGWTDRVHLVEAERARAGAGPENGAGAETAGADLWELPVLGPVRAPQAVLIRPDGHVAWTGGPADLGLTEALTTWFGPPTE